MGVYFIVMTVLLSDYATAVGLANVVMIAPNKVNEANPIDSNHTLISDLDRSTNAFQFSEGIWNRGLNTDRLSFTNLLLLGFNNRMYHTMTIDVPTVEERLQLDNLDASTSSPCRSYLPLPV